MLGLARAWFTGAWLTLGLLGGAMGWLLPHSLVLCDAHLVAVPEPESWRGWEIADPGAALGGACPGGDVPVAATGSGPWLRHDAAGGVFVAFGPPRADEAPRERFVAAFVRVAGPHVAFASSRALACTLSVALAMGILVVGLVAARRRLRAARALSRASRDARSAGAVSASTYRRSSAPAAGGLLDDGVDAPTAEGLVLAIRALRAATLVALGILTLLFVCAGGVVLGEWARQTL